MSENANQEKERPWQTTTVYAEVSPRRAREILGGILESTLPFRDHPNRWLAELSLDRYQPDELKVKGIGRRQTIFASPIPYQGHEPVKGRVLLALDVDPQAIYVAEGNHVSAIRARAGGIQNILLLKEIAPAPRKGMTRKEFERKFNATPQEAQDQLLAGVKTEAEAYWASVVSYPEYKAGKETYHEPEILMTPATQMSNMKKVES